MPNSVTRLIDDLLELVRIYQQREQMYAKIIMGLSDFSMTRQEAADIIDRHSKELQKRYDAISVGVAALPEKDSVIDCHI